MSDLFAPDACCANCRYWEMSLRDDTPMRRCLKSRVLPTENDIDRMGYPRECVLTGPEFCCLHFTPAPLTR